MAIKTIPERKILVCDRCPTEQVLNSEGERWSGRISLWVSGEAEHIDLCIACKDDFLAWLERKPE